MKTSDLVYVYQLVEVSRLTRMQDRLERMILKCLGLKVDTDKRHFSIGLLCGWMYFQDLNYTANVAPGRHLVNPEKVVAAFRASLIEAMKSENEWLDKADHIPTLIPDGMRLIEVCPHYTESSKITYWTLTYGVYLRADSHYGSKALPVHNAFLSFDVSGDGKIVGFSWQWRPIEKRINSTLIAPPEHDDHDAHEGAEAAPVRTYVLQGESTIQTHLAPFYYFNSGHHGSTLSASKHSLAIEVLKNVDGDLLTLTAVPTAGSGDYAYSWAMRKLIEDDYFDLGIAQNCTLEPGAFVISILVEDLVTGVRVQQQESIYFEGILEEDAVLA